MTKLIDQIKELQATAQERAEQQVREETARRIAEAEEDARLGREFATARLAGIRERIISLATDNQTFTTIPVQSSSNLYELSDYEEAYTKAISDSLEDEGLTVALIRDRHLPMAASSGQPILCTYSAQLHVSW